MSKNRWIGLTGVLAAVSIVGLVMFLIASKKQSRETVQNVSPSATSPSTSDETSAAVTYKDPIGLSFEYPRGLSVVDQTPDDSAYYTLLLLKNTKGEMMKLTVKDVEASSLAQWMTSSESTIKADATLVGPVQLAGMSASQYRQSGKLITLALDSHILYELVGPADDGFWSRVHDTLVTTFVFEKPEQPAVGSSASENTTVEPEEIVE